MKKAKIPSPAKAGTTCGCPTKLVDLQQLSFALVDLNLYLDTHPNCQQAIDDYNTIYQQYWDLRTTYEMQNGPLANFGYCPANYPFSWINTPWPWEKPAN